MSPPTFFKLNTTLFYSIMLFFVMSCSVNKNASLSLHEITDFEEKKALIEKNDKEAVKTHIKLIANADKEMDKGPYSVTHKTGMPPSNNKHDYLSQAPYFWPDRDSPDGKPYIRHDGRINPETRNNYTDFVELKNFFDAVEILGKAYYYSDNKKYAEKAVALIDYWFLNPETKMNPNLNYGQGIPGITDGRPFGIIEFGGIADVITTMELLKIGGWNIQKTEAGLKSWLTEYSQWLQTSENGMLERTRSNNHGTTYDIQLISILLYLEEFEQVKSILEDVKISRIASQIEPDGSQPHELARTKSFSYSMMNLRAMTRLAWFGKKMGVDLWGFETADGRSIKKAYSFFIPYLTGEKEWEHEQIASIDYKESILNLLKDADKIFNEPQYKELSARYSESSNQ